MTTAANTPVTLIIVLTVKPEQQQHALVDSLRHNTETVIQTLPGWLATSLIASTDGQRVIIHSQWESAADLDGMRSDPRMQAYFPVVNALASLDSTRGTVVMNHQRR
jgi:quinol monooxygenase YgiN